MRKDSRTKRLGRGLSSLISSPNQPELSETEASKSSPYSSNAQDESSSLVPIAETLVSRETQKAVSTKAGKTNLADSVSNESEASSSDGLTPKVANHDSSKTEAESSAVATTTISNDARSAKTETPSFKSSGSANLSKKRDATAIVSRETEVHAQHAFYQARKKRSVEAKSSVVDDIALAASDTVSAKSVPIDSLTPNPFQPRLSFLDTTIEELAESIRKNGVIQPLVVRETTKGLVIVVGERRWRAAKVAQLTNVPVICRDLTDEQMLEWALVENIHREDLNAVDRAEGYRRFIKHLGLSTEEVARRLGEDRSTVANYLRLLDLPRNVRSLLASGEISMGHARALLGLNDKLRMGELGAVVAETRMSVRALEDQVRRERASTIGTKSGQNNRAGTPMSHILEQEREFEQSLGVRVQIRMGRSKSKGKLVIDFYSLDDFDRIKARIIQNNDAKK